MLAKQMCSRIGATLLASSLALMAFTPGAFAGPNPNADGAPSTGSIHIVKHQNDGKGKPFTGKQENGLTQPKLQNVKFTLKKVKDSEINLKTNEGWKKLYEEYTLKGAMPSADKLEDAAGACAGELTTNEQGAIDCTGLALGAYVLTELPSPDAQIVGGEKVTVSPTAPMLITLPMTDPVSTNDWLYDLYIYPKNSTVKVTKTVNDQGSYAGQEISYDVVVPLPAITEGKVPAKFVISDTLPKGVTLADTDPVTVKAVNLSEELQQSDYTIENTKVTFKWEGLKKMVYKANAIPTVTVTYKVKIDPAVLTTAADTNGVLTNTANLTWTPGHEGGEDPNSPTPPNPDGPTPPGELPPVPSVDIPSNPVKSVYGKIKVVKKNKADDKLQNAEFKIKQCDGQDFYKDPKNTGQDWVVTTDQNGEASFDGIQVSNFANNAAVEEGNQKELCLVETKAPEGYELLVEPVRVKLTSQGGDPSAPAAVVELSQDVVNVPKNGGFNLPITGAAGMIIFSIGGLLIAAGGILVAKRAFKTAK